MAILFSDKIKSYTENINFELFIPTIFIMLLSFIYFFFRLRRLRQPINIDNENDNRNINNNINQRNNQNNNINNNANENNENDRIYHITIQMERNRHNFDIKLSDNIGEFVTQKIYPLTNNRTVYLIYQGQILNQSQPFSFCEHRITDNMVILCKIRENNNRGQNNNHYDDNVNERQNEQLRNDPTSVSIYSIFTHIFIMIIFGFLIFSYKSFKEIFTKQTIRMIQILCIIWALSFSNSVSKLIFYKKISY